MRRTSMSLRVGLSRRHSSSQALDVVRVPASAQAPQRKTKVVLIHGMWHGAWFWEPLQELLGQAGFQSFAIDQRPASMKKKDSYLEDLSVTLDAMDSDDLNDAVILGHSQGGILTQYLLRDYFPTRTGVSLRGAVMCGTIPLHITRGGPQEMQLIRTSIKEHGFRGNGVYANWTLRQSIYFNFTGKLLDSDAAHRIFLLPSTTETTVCGGLKMYYDRMVNAPSDGWPTFEHILDPKVSLSFPLMDAMPILVLGADADKCYNAFQLSPIWEHRFPHRDEVIVPNQGHCFADPGWEEGMGGALVNWLEKVESAAASR